MYEKASKALKTNLDSADIYAVKALRLASDKEVWKAYFLQGLISKKRKEYNRSINLYKLSIKYTPNASNKLYVFNNLANVFFESGQYEKAEPFANKVKMHREKTKHPYLYNSLGVLAKIHAKKGRLDSAKYYFAKAISLIPYDHDRDGQTTAGFVVAKADMYCDAAQYDAAIVLYQQAVDLQKTPYDRCETHLSIAKCLLLQGKYRKVKEYLDKAYKLQGDYLRCQVQVLRLRLDLEYKMKKLREVEATCETLASLVDNSSITQDKELYNDIQRQIQRKLLYVAKARGNKVNRILFVIVMLIPVTLLARLLLRKKSPKNHKNVSNNLTVIKHLNNDEALLKELNNVIDDFNLNGPPGRRFK